MEEEETTVSIQNATHKQELSMFQLSMQYTEFKVAMAISLYGTPLMVPVGMVGNLLSLLVMLQPQNRRISCCVYMAVLAVSDNTVLFVAGYYWMLMQFRESRFYLAECKILDFLLFFGSFLGVLLVIAMTVDRMIAVRFPLQSRAWCTVQRARITIACLTCFSFAYNFPYIIYTYPKTVRCIRVVGRHWDNYMWSSTILNALVPFVLLMTMNSIIIHTLRQRNKQFTRDSLHHKTAQDQPQNRGQQSADSASGKDNVKERQLTIMLVVVSFAALALTLPRYLSYTIIRPMDLDTPHLMAIATLFAHLTTRLYVMNNAINFFLYTVAGSKFRHDLLRIFGFGKKRA